VPWPRLRIPLWAERRDYAETSRTRATVCHGGGDGSSAHGWFIGYRGDLAFAVLVEGGGTGADSAGPIANAFLREL
jgi:cell division protein FtsI/penicillin-binding protein 2